MSTGLEPTICVTKKVMIFLKAHQNCSVNLGFKSPNPLFQGVEHFLLTPFLANFRRYYTTIAMQM